MSEEVSWANRTIRECLAESFAGEWGTEPLPGNARVLRATDIDDDGHLISSGALRRLSLNKLNSRRLKDGDILLEGSGGGPDKPVGRVAFFNAAQHHDPAVCSNFFKTLRPNQSVIEPKFLWRMLMWLYRQPIILTLQQQTTGIINLKFEEYLNANIEIPTNLGEQRSIAKILDTLDTSIREAEKIIDKLKAVKQSLLHDLLTRGIDANGELRPPQSEAPQLYKESQLRWTPKEWRCETLNSTIEGSPRNGIYKPASHIGSGVLLVGQTAFTSEGSVDFTQARRARVSDVECDVFGLRENDLLVSRVFATREGVGQPVIVPKLLSAAVYESNMMRLRVKQQVMLPHLLFHWLKHPTARAWIMSRAFASNQASINRETICSVPVPLPSISEQRTILAVVMSHDSRLRDEMHSLTKLQILKYGLMDDLLTGRVRVTPLLEGAIP